jgi:hypothetical protein
LLGDARRGTPRPLVFRHIEDFRNVLLVGRQVARVAHFSRLFHVDAVIRQLAHESFCDFRKRLRGDDALARGDLFAV